jgi:hypothetical protein
VDDRPTPDVPGAELKPTDAGLKPAEAGWFVLNLADAAWRSTPGWGRHSDSESPGAQFEQIRR